MRHRFGAALLVFVSFGLAAPADAGKLGQEFRVNTEKGGDQEAPAVAGLSNGDFVIVWKNFGQSGNLGGMYFQRYSAGGTKLGGETRVNSNGTTVQFAPSVAALENGRFVVVWTSPDDGSGSGVYMQRYDADGLPLGKAKRCNTFTSGNKAMPSVSALSNGGYIVAWRSSGQDGSGTGIYGQRFRFLWDQGGRGIPPEYQYLPGPNPSTGRRSRQRRFRRRLEFRQPGWRRLRHLRSALSLQRSQNRT